MRARRRASCPKARCPPPRPTLRDLRATSQALRNVTEKIDDQGAGSLLGGAKLPDYKP